MLKIPTQYQFFILILEMTDTFPPESVQLSHRLQLSPTWSFKCIYLCNSVREELSIWKLSLWFSIKIILAIYIHLWSKYPHCVIDNYFNKKLLVNSYIRPRYGENISQPNLPLPKIVGFQYCRQYSSFNFKFSFSQ